MSDPFGLSARETLQDPYPIYARLRAEAPVFFCEPWGAWVFTRHDDVQAAFRDPRWSADRAGMFAARLDAETRARVEPLIRNLRGWALLMDPPAHTRVRGLLNRAFTPKLINGLRPRIEALVAELLDKLDDEIDLMESLATPLPVMVIGDMMGLPAADRVHLKRWSDDLAAFLGAGRATFELVTGAVRAVMEIEDYFRAQLAARRKAPGDDMLSALCTAEEAGTILDEQELVSTCAMILFGGHETTTHLIGNGTLALMSQRGEWEKLTRAPELAENAVEELLRFDAPVQRMGRVAKEPMEWRGQRVEPGQRLFLMLGAANRDPEEFESPDRLDLRRAANKQVAFGWGPHYCVGAGLGRLEAELAFAALARRFPHTALVEKPEFQDNVTIRGLRALRLRIRA
jgi:cytochrome P450